MHLDPPTYARLLAGTLPPKEAQALAAHLAGDCERCEQFLAEQGTADGFDGLTDEALAAALPPADAAGNDLEYARIQRRLRTEGHGRRRRFLPAALAASLAIAGVAGIVAQQLRSTPPAEAPWDGVKGTEARPIPVRLRFLRLGAAGEVVKGLPGEAVDRSARLLFEVEAGRGADVAIARVSPGGGVELVWRQHVAGGRTQVTVGGKPAAYPLDGLSGPQRFVLVAAESGLDEGRASRAAAALAPPQRLRADAPALDGLSVDVVELSVR